MTKTRKDNVEYHDGAKAFLGGFNREACPYMTQAHADSRRARWLLGWDDALAETHAGDRMARDYTGKLCPMPKPEKGELIAAYEEGFIELWKTGKGSSSFAVVYGLQIKQGLDYASAASELGYCLLHSLQCEGKLD